MPGPGPGRDLAQIAKAAGVGRVTLYGHFPPAPSSSTRSCARAFEGERRTRAGRPVGRPPEALTRLIEASWEVVDQSRSLLMAAQNALTPGRIQELHARAGRSGRAADRARAGGGRLPHRPPGLVAGGQLHNVMHGAADEIHAGRLTADDAALHRRDRTRRLHAAGQEGAQDLVVGSPVVVDAGLLLSGQAPGSRP